MLEVYREGSQNGNASEFRDPGKDIVRVYRLESEEAQKHEQPNGGGHNDRWAHVRTEFVKVVRTHAGCSHRRLCGGQIPQGSVYECKQDDCMKIKRQLEDIEQVDC